MKKITTLLVAVGLSATAAKTFAAAPSGSANPANMGCNAKNDRDDEEKHIHDHMSECAKKIQEEAKKDARQDAQGQKKLDQDWAKLLQDMGIDPKSPDAPKDPYVYEGSQKDMQQDAKNQQELDKFLAKHGCPPVSPS